MLGCVLLLDILSIPLIDSATHALDNHYYARKQAILVLASLFVLALGTFLDYRDMVSLSPALYAITGALLVVVLFFGKEVNGSTRWIPLGFFDLQPSELAKISMLLFTAYLLSRWEEAPSSIVEFALYYAWVLVPMALILKQPDLGTALVLIVVTTGALYFGGAPGKLLTRLIVVGVVTIIVVLALHFYAGLPLPLEDYQIKRITTLLDPNGDPLGTGYQVLQSRIAIGSGSLWGKGLGQGTQNRLDFIPFQQTDFIFSVVGEELGFVKSALVLGVYLVLLYRCLLAAVNSTDRRGTVVAGGVLTLLLFHLLVNMGMTMGIMPVTGVPLPFLSYGGSALLVNSFAVGMVLNVGWRRHKILF
ncbi:MAG: rod shape-determining protein RodA [Bacillota bacterium]